MARRQHRKGIVMGFPKEIYDKAAAVLSSRRQAAKEQSLRHRQEIYRLLPQIEQIDSQLRRIGMQTIQAVAGSPERLDTIIERLKQQSLGCLLYTSRCV